MSFNVLQCDCDYFKIFKSILISFGCFSYCTSTSLTSSTQQPAFAGKRSKQGFTHQAPNGAYCTSSLHFALQFNRERRMPKICACSKKTHAFMQFNLFSLGLSIFEQSSVNCVKELRLISNSQPTLREDKVTYLVKFRLV